MLLRFASDLEEYGKVEQMPVLEEKRMTIFISPKKVSKSNGESKPSEVAVREEKKAPKAKAPKEYKAPTIEGE